jgi:SAM-dependent methyltransferase
MEIYERMSVLTTTVRLRILKLLFHEELNVGEVSQILQLPPSTMSRHLKTLHEAEWTVQRKVGTSILYTYSDILSERQNQLWELLYQDIENKWQDDQIRLQGILAQRARSSHDFFSEVAGRWREIRKTLYGDSFLMQLLLALIDHDLVIADLGCGAGDVLALLAQNGNRVIGIDREPSMLEAARNHVADYPHVDLRLGYLEKPPLAVQEIDLALLNLVLHVIEDIDVVFKAIHQALQTKGRLLVLDMLAHDRTEYRRTMGHIHLGFTQEQLQTHADQAGLCCIEFRTLRSDLNANGPALFLALFEKKNHEVSI